MPKARAYRDFRIGDIFELKTSKKKYNANTVILGKGYPYVVRTSSNNAIKGLIDEDPKFLNSGNTISFGQDTATINYQPKAYFTGDKIKIMSFKPTKLNEHIASYLISAMRKAFSSFSWGVTSFNETILKDVEISLPIDKNGELDLMLMEETVRRIDHDYRNQIVSRLNFAGFEDSTLTTEEEQALAANVIYKSFDIVKVFNVVNSHNILKSDVAFGSGSIPYVTACEGNNSIVSHISYKDDAKEEGNSIMIGGKTLVITYQPKDFFSNDSHNLVLKINDVNGRTETAQLFMVAALYKSLSPKYSWGDSISKAKIQKDKVSFPVAPNGCIDFNYMETYIRAIMKQTIGKLKSAMTFTQSMHQ